MRRKIHCVLRIVESVNVQIDFDPVVYRHSSTDYADLRRLNLETSAPRQRSSVSCFPEFLIKFLARSGGGTGRHVRLRGVCRKACGFKSRPEHDIYFTAAKVASRDGQPLSRQI